MLNASDDSMEEIMLQGMTIGYVKVAFDEKKTYLEKFVHKIDNWSVCDSTCASMKPIVDGDVEKIWNYLLECVQSTEEYVIRFGIVMMLDHFVTPEYIKPMLKILNEVSHDGYYVKMAVAWAISVCYVKYATETMELLEKNSLDNFTYNKALQKIVESYRVSKEEKQIMRGMKRK